MSRLYDRVLAEGCSPLRFSSLGALAAPWQARLERPVDRVLADDPQARMLLRSRLDPGFEEVFDAGALEGAPCVAVDNVAAYVAGLAGGAGLEDLTATTAPPFERFWVEAQRPAGWGGRIDPLHAWGALVEALEFPAGERPAAVDFARRLLAGSRYEHDELVGLGEDPVRWLLRLTLVIEPRKHHPVGPAQRLSLFVDEDGSLVRYHLGRRAIVRFTHRGRWCWGGDAYPLPDADAALLEHQLTCLLVPVLLGISLMHCRNVTSVETAPAAGLSRKHQRRTGRPLVSYRVLEIGPMTRRLDRDGRAVSGGLGQALHICRGHFKTFTDAAPLFGKHTGQWWWHDLVRGDAAHGEARKSYRVHPTTPT